MCDFHACTCTAELDTQHLGVFSPLSYNAEAFTKCSYYIMYYNSCWNVDKTLQCIYRPPGIHVYVDTNNFKLLIKKGSKVAQLAVNEDCLMSQKMMYKCLVLLTVLAVQQAVVSTTSDSDGKSTFKHVRHSYSIETAVLVKSQKLL